jgi:hypothetical protein
MVVKLALIQLSDDIFSMLKPGVRAVSHRAIQHRAIQHRAIQQRLPQSWKILLGCYDCHVQTYLRLSSTCANEK